MMIQGRDVTDSPTSASLPAADHAAPHAVAGCELASTAWAAAVGGHSGNGSASGFASSAPAINGDSGVLTQEEI